MSVGSDAIAEGYSLVPDSGEEGKVRHGAREINRTRDYVAALKRLIQLPWAVTKGGTGADTVAGARTNLGIKSGTGVPTGGVDGDIYFQIIL